MVEKIVVLGAFDRYNYGDNLMPILFEIFVKKYYSEVYEKHEWIYAALTESDLTRYGAKRTRAMADVFRDQQDAICAVISIGGEVLRASSSTLFLHMDHSDKLRAFISFLKNNGLSLLADGFCRRLYNLPWEYPYIPRKVSQQWRVGFNTVGGDVPRRLIGTYLHGVRDRLNDADYLSVRDTRTQTSLQHFSSPELSPDSAIVMANLLTDKFLIQSCSTRINELNIQKYMCFQASPQKAGATAQAWAERLLEIAEKYDLTVVLCPIGYARGHDDLEFLEQVNRHANGSFELLAELNLWEIMSVIRQSSIFMGTSLHGIITCLSFAVPHIGLNPRISKLDKFLADWGVPPSNRCYSIGEVVDACGEVLRMDLAELKQQSEYLRDLGMNNNHRMVRALGLCN